MTNTFANTIFDFINGIKKERSDKAIKIKYNTDPANIDAALVKQSKNIPGILIGLLLGKLYKDSLPDNNPDKNISDQQASVIMGNAIEKVTGNKNIVEYVNNMAKTKKSLLLETVVKTAQNVSYEYLENVRKEKRIVDLDSLNYNPNLEKSIVDRVYKNLEFDEISEMINQNVINTIEEEKQRAIREEEEDKNLENMLSDDEDVYDDTTLESALVKHSIHRDESYYQPSLFEGIMLSNNKVMTESAIIDVYDESVKEYTKLSSLKALKLLDWNLPTLRDKARYYK